MANHASHAALPYPVKNARFTLLIPYLDADGDPTDPTTPDTEISKDDGAAADTAEEVASPKNSVGMLTLTGAETDCSCLSLAAKAASGPKTTLMTVYPRVMPVLFSGTAQAGAAGTLTLATDVPAVADLLIGCILKTTGGTGGGGTGGANNQARVITDFTTGRVASVSPNWETTPDGTTNYEVLLTEQALLRYADVKLWRGSEPNALVSSRVDSSVQHMANDVVTAAAIAADAVTEIQSGLATAANLATVAGYIDTEVATIVAAVDTEVAAIKAVTDALPAAVAAVQADTDNIQTRLPAALVGGRMDANISAINNATGGVARLERAIRAIITGTVGAGSTTTSVVSSALDPAGAVADQFKGQILAFDKDTTTAALRGQKTDITGNTSSGTPTFSVTALTTAPVSGDTFTIE